MNEQPALALHAVSHAFTQAGGNARLEVLRGIDLRIAPGEMVALVGPSGAGKSTLLHIAGLLEAPDAGRVIIGGQDCSDLGDHERTLARRQKLGFVYQFHHLLPEFTALENIMLPQMIRGLGQRQARDRSSELLRMVGLSERQGHRPAILTLTPPHLFLSNCAGLPKVPNWRPWWRLITLTWRPAWIGH